MNIQVFLFKVLLVLLHIALLTAVFLPITYILVYSKEGGWQYGFTFIQSSFEAAIFGAFAFAFVLVSYHSLSFEMAGKVPLSAYLRAKQKVRVKGNISMEKLQNMIRTEMKIRKFEAGEKALSFRKLVYFTPPDRVEIYQKSDGYELISRPFSNIWIIDFARNYNTVKKLARWIKAG
jgi:hypothetical protein